MAGNGVDFLLRVRDLGTPTLNRFRSNVTGAGSAWTSFVGNLASGVVIRGLEAATDGVRGLTGAILDGALIQTQNLASASDIALNLGVPLKDAQGIVTDTQVQIANIAAALPGVTRDYQQVFNGVSGAIADQFRGDTETFQAVSIDITKRVGALSAIRGTDASMSASAITRLLAGTAGFGEISQVDILQKNPQLVKNIRARAAELGVEMGNWKNLAADTRLDIVSTALKIAAPDSFLESFTGTFESMLEGMKTAVFDPTVGTFGVLRVIAERGGRNVMDSARSALGQFLALSQEVGQLLDRSGLSFDPMAGVIDFLDGVTGLFTQAALDLDSLPDFSWDSLQTLADSWYQATRSRLDSIDFFAVGARVADWVTGALGFIFSPQTMARSRGAMATSLGILVEASGGFIRTLAGNFFEALVRKATVGYYRLLGSIVFPRGTVGRSIGQAITWLLGKAVGLYYTMLRKVVLPDAIWEAGPTVGDLLGSAWGGFTGLVEDGWEWLVSKVEGKWESLADIFQDTWDGLVDLIQGLNPANAIREQGGQLLVQTLEGAGAPAPLTQAVSGALGLPEGPPDPLSLPGLTGAIDGPGLPLPPAVSQAAQSTLNPVFNITSTAADAVEVAQEAMALLESWYQEQNQGRLAAGV